MNNESDQSWQCGDRGTGVINVADVGNGEGTTSSSRSSGGSGELDI